jgi:septal ring factor EnvC (AmiA/AmiB activator)
MGKQKMEFSLITSLCPLATWTAILGTVNLTVIFSVISICLAAMGALIKIFGPNHKINDENLRNSPYLIGLEKDIKEKESKLKEEIKDKENKLNGLKEIVNVQHVEVEKLKVESKNSSKSLEELKQDNRDLVQRLDDLLKQFMEYMEG